LRTAALGLWLAGSVVPLIIGLWAHVHFFLEGFRYPYTTHDLGYTSTLILAIVSLLVVFLVKIKAQKFFPMMALIVAVICSTGYVFLYWISPPLGFGLLYVDSNRGVPAIIIVLICVPLMLAGASLFLINERRGRSKPRNKPGEYQLPP